MEWCDHCCRFCLTRLETIVDDFSGKYCRSCTMCGKILLDSRRIKKRRKTNNNVKIVNKQRDAASKGPLIKEVKQLINSDATQVSDDC